MVVPIKGLVSSFIFDAVHISTGTNGFKVDTSLQNPGPGNILFVHPRQQSILV